EWWRRMAALIHVAAKSSDSDLMEALDAAKKARWGSGFPQVEVTTPQNLAPSPQSASPEPACLLVEADAPEKCFKIANDFVRQQVQAVVNDYYLGTDANLALIEIALYDHNQLQKRNSHTAYVKALVAWGILTVADEDKLKSIVSSIADKHKRLPKEGYKEWSQDFINDKTACENIGKALGQTMPYQR
ncbi:MAG: hypothetical protein IJ886_05625, partial [Prevotella sp.]|nr:hypothetical protein [Prevotella sp.]